jgi:hypothetical protein
MGLMMLFELSIASVLRNYDRVNRLIERRILMNDQTLFKRITAVSAIVSALLMLAANIVTSIAVDFRFEFLADPAGLLTAGLDTGSLRLFRLGEIMGVFGYCLLLIPLTIYLWYWLRRHNSGFVSLITILGLISIIFGVLEYGVRFTIWPSMMVAYSQAGEVQREVIQVVFSAVTDFAFEGMYGLSAILFGIWGLGIGLVLRTERRILGIITAVMGVAILGAGFGWLLQVDPLARLEMFYFLEPVWAVWLGLVIWRRDEGTENMPVQADSIMPLSSEGG